MLIQDNWGAQSYAQLWEANCAKLSVAFISLYRGVKFCYCDTFVSYLSGGPGGRSARQPTRSSSAGGPSGTVLNTASHSRDSQSQSENGQCSYVSLV